MHQEQIKLENIHFRGREAKLNFAIIETLAFNPNLIKSEITKEVKKNPQLLQRIRKIKKLKVVPSTVSRRVNALETEGWIEKTGKRPISLFEGAITHEYSLSFKGVINIVSLSPMLPTGIDGTIKIIENYPNMLLAFKKWPLFKETVLDPEMLKNILNSILDMSRMWILISTDYKSPRKCPFCGSITIQSVNDGTLKCKKCGCVAKEGQPFEDIKKALDSAIFFHRLIEHKNKNLAEVYKGDPEIKAFIESELKLQLEEHENLHHFEKWWDNV